MAKACWAKCTGRLHRDKKEKLLFSVSKQSVWLSMEAVFIMESCYHSQKKKRQISYFTTTYDQTLQWCVICIYFFIFLRDKIYELAMQHLLLTQSEHSEGFSQSRIIFNVKLLFRMWSLISLINFIMQSPTLSTQSKEKGLNFLYATKICVILIFSE